MNADGIAHELNTPLQFVGDNLRFTGRGISELGRWLRAVDDFVEAARTGSVDPKLLERLDVVRREADIDYLLGELPVAIEQALEGVERAAAVVDAMKADALREDTA